MRDGRLDSRRIIYNLITAEVGARKIVDIVRIYVSLPATFERSCERRNGRNHQPDRRHHNNEGGPAWLQPYTVVVAERDSSVVDHDGVARRVAQNGAAVGVRVIVTETPVVMLVVGLTLICDLGNCTGRAKVEDTEEASRAHLSPSLPSAAEARSYRRSTH